MANTIKFFLFSGSFLEVPSVDLSLEDVEEMIASGEPLIFTSPSGQKTLIYPAAVGAFIVTPAGITP